MFQMTLYDLNEHFELRERLAKSEELLMRLREAATPGAQNITGMPRVIGKSDRVGNLAVEIADIEKTLPQLRRQVEQSEKRVLAYIDQISDMSIRTVIRLRFIRCLQWSEVAEIVGGGNTPESVRMLCYRYLRDQGYQL